MMDWKWTFSLLLLPDSTRWFYYRQKPPGTKRRNNSHEMLDAGKQMGLWHLTQQAWNCLGWEWEHGEAARLTLCNLHMVQKLAGLGTLKVGTNGENKGKRAERHPESLMDPSCPFPRELLHQQVALSSQPTIPGSAAGFCVAPTSSLMCAFVAYLHHKNIVIDWETCSDPWK